MSGEGIPLQTHDEVPEFLDGVFCLFVSGIECVDPSLLVEDDKVLVVDFFLHLLLRFDVVNFKFIVEFTQGFKVLDSRLELFDLLVLVHELLGKVFKHLLGAFSSVKLRAEVFNSLFGKFKTFSSSLVFFWPPVRNV